MPAVTAPAVARREGDQVLEAGRKSQHHQLARLDRCRCGGGFGQLGVGQLAVPADIGLPVAESGTGRGDGLGQEVVSPQR